MPLWKKGLDRNKMDTDLFLLFKMTLETNSVVL